MLAIIKGGHRIRGNGYVQKLYLRSMDKNQNIEDSIKKEVKNATSKVNRMDVDMNKDNFRSMVNTQNIEDATEKEVKKATSKIQILEKLYRMQNHEI
jgi:glutamate formiminotransferase